MSSSTAHGKVFFAIAAFACFQETQSGGPRIPRSMPGAVHTWNSGHYFYGPVYLVFICFYSPWPSRVCRLARLCAHSGQFFGYGPFVSTEGTNGLRYSRDFAYQVIARELALALMYIKAPGPSATEGRWLTRGDWRSSWFAESQVCSAHSVPLLIMFPFFPRPLTIDPAGRTGVTQVGQWYSGWYVACYVGGYSF